MKRITQLLTALVFCSLVIFVACKKKKKEDDDPDPRDQIGAALEGKTWAPTSVQYGDATRTEWSDFTISFAYSADTDLGNYTVNNVPTDSGAEEVWDTSQSTTVNWTFDESSIDGLRGIIDRADGTRMTYVLNSIENPTELTISFTIEDPNERVTGFYGEWEFVFSVQ